MKKLLLSLVLVATLVAFGATQAEADDISVTVTITATLSVSVSPGTWAIGPIAEGAEPNTTLPDYFTATNGSNTTADLTITIAGSDDWAFANTPDADQFGMNFSTGGASPAWTLIDSLIGGSLANGLTAGSTQKFDLQLEAPTSTTVGGTPQTIVVTVTASAAT
ncbi:MAG: hypothetical protein ISS66_02620 [Desulfobacteraceae bacterium]|nr:hypothetical protein [Desulfobacteraceae bacterium]